MAKSVHFMGIGGSGASAVAAIAQAQGFKVTGCDKAPDNEFTQPFKKEQLFKDSSPKHLDGVDILAITPAITALDPGNREIKTAESKNIAVMTWQQFMGVYLEKGKFTVAVCGTHGKSTTTAMIGLLLEQARLDPTVEVGALVPKWNKNYRVGKSKYFVTEADEFNDNFLVTHPNIAVVTSIEMDHPEYFKDFEDYKRSFVKFLSQTKDLIIANLSDPSVAEVVKTVMKDTRVKSIDYTRSNFDLHLQIPGKFNLLNAAAAFQVGLSLGIDPQTIKTSLESYHGIGRRLEYLGEHRGAQVYSDFAHHPTEIHVTLQAIKEKVPTTELILVFQPHMFSRTKVLFDQFVSVLKSAPVSHAFILDIYPSREVDTGLVSSKQLVEAIEKEAITYVKDIGILFELLNQTSFANSTVIFMGAGDTHSWAKKLVGQN